MADQNHSGQGWQYTNGAPGGSGQRPPQKNDWGGWIGIVILFLIPTWITKVIAVIMGVKKLAGMSRSQRNQYRQEFRQDMHQAADTVRTDARRVASDVRSEFRSTGAATKTGPKVERTASKTRQSSNAGLTGKKAGLARTIWGAILSGVFALGLTGTLSTFIQSLGYGYFFADEFTAVLACLIFLAGGVGLLFSGIGARSQQERFLNYLAYIGANREVELAPMAAAFDVPVKKLCRDLRKMLAKKILPTGYLDLASGKLFLTEMGYQAPEPEPAKTKTDAEAEDEDAKILREIRQVNDDIPDEVMSAKIDRIEELTGKILAYQKAHPDKSSQLRSFLNYYLPTTLKILRAYAQLDAQGIEGENISAAKARIEGMMDQVVSGFEKQLDKLFQNEAMDVNTDVQVLENMLKKDGLSDDQGMTMTM